MDSIFRDGLMMVTFNEGAGQENQAPETAATSLHISLKILEEEPWARINQRLLAQSSSTIISHLSLEDVPLEGPQAVRPTLLSLPPTPPLACPPENQAISTIENLEASPAAPTIRQNSSPSSPAALLLETLSILSPNLRHVSLTGTQVSHAGTIRSICDILSQQTSLISLDISNNAGWGPRGMKTMATQLLAVTSNLQNLHLARLNLGDFGAQALGSALPPTLRRLSVASNRMGHDGVWKLVTGTTFQALRPKWQELDLSDNEMGDDGGREVLRQITIMPQLRILNLAHNNIGPMGVTALAEALRMHRPPGWQQNELEQQEGDDQDDDEEEEEAEKVDIQGNVLNHQIESAALLPMLIELNLKGNKLGNAGAVHVGQALPFLIHLQVLDLSSNQIADDGCSALAKACLEQQERRFAYEAKSRPSGHETLLVSGLRLQLNDNRIGDEGATTWVEAVDELPKLLSLDLSGNVQVSEARLRILNLLLSSRRASPRRSRSGPSLQATTHDQRGAPTTLLSSVGATTEGDHTKEKMTPVRENSGGGKMVGDNSSPAQHELIIDDKAVKEGRDILWSTSQDSDVSIEGTNLNLLSRVPFDYVLFTTNRFGRECILCHGAFGPLYGARDNDSMCASSVVIRYMPLGPAGPLDSVRNVVLSEIKSIAGSCAFLMPAIAFCNVNNHLLNAGLCFLYDVSDHQSLRDVLMNHRKDLNWERRVAILHCVAEALEFLHTGGLSGRQFPALKPTFHGDVQPANIYVSYNYMLAKLVDAGMSRLLITDRSRFLSGDVVFGTRGYRCPRYERGSCSYDATSDMFSLGVLIAEVMTGRLQRSDLSNKASGMAWDVYYDVILAGATMQTDPAGGPLSAGVMETLGKMSFACMSSVQTQHRPSATTISAVFAQLLKDLKGDKHAI